MSLFASSLRWAFGILMYFTLYGRYPFDGNNVREILLTVLHGTIDWESDVPLASWSKQQRGFGEMVKCRRWSPRQQFNVIFGLSGNVVKLQATLFCVDVQETHPVLFDESYYPHICIIQSAACEPGYIQFLYTSNIEKNSFDKSELVSRGRNCWVLAIVSRSSQLFLVAKVHIDPKTVSLLKGCLQRKPRKRTTAKACKKRRDVFCYVQVCSVWV